MEDHQINWSLFIFFYPEKTIDSCQQGLVLSVLQVLHILVQYSQKHFLLFDGKTEDGVVSIIRHCLEVRLVDWVVLGPLCENLIFVPIHVHFIDNLLLRQSVQLAYFFELWLSNALDLNISRDVHGLRLESLVDPLIILVIFLLSIGCWLIR